MATDQDKPGWLPAVWDAPVYVRAGMTTRIGGISPSPWNSLNLALHTGDDPGHVLCNRSRLMQTLNLPAEPVWLDQVHGNHVVRAGQDVTPEADAVWTDQAGVVCAVMTADCVPVLFCDDRGRRIAAVHAGWRGLLAGVLQHSLMALGNPGPDMHAWIGPHIGQAAYEVGDDMRESCLTTDRRFEAAFVPGRGGRWQASLEMMIRIVLGDLGLTRISSSGLCTHERDDLFYSYRRDGPCGRMAALIWIAPD